ncbi:hypothetical protein HYC85_025605 [Camellia sinensis]|uniref:O-fucosyltransferase family protein n=1 Tax=Camellia sinensis TaxID=4442 RepID=A0A7J7GBH7_CAMSI|nr:hypothetical protein HYC85_025605 [Camellia sinensis]
MAIRKTPKSKQKPRSGILILTVSIAVIAFLCLISSLNSTNGFSFSSTKNSDNLYYHRPYNSSEKYLFWGNRIDCPGKHCQSCEGLGHQESSLRCALEEAMFLQRTFVMPSRMCISPIHNKKGILYQSDNATSQERWAANSCAMDSLYDLELISNTVPVILDNSEAWHQALSTSMMLGSRGIAHVQGVSRADLKEKSRYSNILLINQTASPLSWFMECKDRNNRSAVMLSYSFLPSMVAKKLRDAAEKVLKSGCGCGCRNGGGSAVAGCKGRSVTVACVTGRYSTVTTAIAAATADTPVNLNHTAKAALTGGGNYHNRYVTALRNGCGRFLKPWLRIKALLGDYDAIHVRRGDKLKTRKDSFGIDKALHPHLDRDTRPEFILCRISKWVPPGRTLFIASNERTPGFFSPLGIRYKLAYSSNYSSILDRFIENNYQLFMIERLIIMGAKTIIKTFKQEETDLSLTDDPKKNTKSWQIPVYTMDGEGC